MDCIFRREKSHCSTKRLFWSLSCLSNAIRIPAHTSPWRKANIQIVLGTDSGACNDTVNVQGELRFFAGADTYGVPQSTEMQSFMQEANWHHAQQVRAKRQKIYTQRQDHISPSQILSSVWSSTAHMHPMAPVGGIEKGRWANIAIWDINHPVFWPGTDILHTLVYAKYLWRCAES